MKQIVKDYQEVLGYKPSEYQEKIFNFVVHGSGNAVIKARAGSGKCLGVDTPILMYDGSIKKVQDIVIGDLLMGDDSTPRKVLSTTVGTGNLCKIVPKKGDEWVCNDVHVLTLAKYKPASKNTKGKYNITDIPINELSSLSKHPDGNFRNVKLVRTGVEFKPQEIKIDPWVYGVWLGDGDTNGAYISTMDDEIAKELEKNKPNDCKIIQSITNKGLKRIGIVRKNNHIKQSSFRSFIRSSINGEGKFIRKEYLINSRAIRLKLLAGLIDSDGYYNNKNYYITTKLEQLSNDILYLCRSLGLGAYSIKKKKKCCNTGATNFYYSITINGDIDEIPVILKRKKAEKRLINKSPLRVGFNVVDNGVGNYYGFTLDGNGRFLLGDFTITHNTATIIAAMKLVPTKKRCLFLAFNKSVKDEIEKKLVGYDNCTVKTVHGLGYSLVANYLGTQPIVDEFKYITYLRHHLFELLTAEVKDKKEIDELCENINQLLEFSRMNLAQSKREIEKIAQEYNIPTENNEIDTVINLMKWGKNSLTTVDFTDLVWLPYELDITPKQNKFDWIFNDEAQDYSVAYVKLFIRCFKRGTRFVSCGDEFQSINQFAGASEQAFTTMVNMPNTQVFDLPISYRCDRVIIKEANLFVPDIMSRPDAGLGLVKHETKLAEIKENDLVLSRTNAALFKLYPRLIKLGKPCYIKGNDDDKNKLLSIIERYGVGEDLGKNFECDGLFPRLYNKMVAERNKLVERGLDIAEAINSQAVQSIYDTISSLLTISADCNTATDLINKINKIYSHSDTGICLSTIHKAKGLEADNVHIVCRSVMPQKYAKTRSEIQQERNLIYVAITRARHKLCYVSEKEFPPVKALDNDSDEQTEFNYIESMVCKLYNKEPLAPIKNAEISKFRLNNATKIESIHKNDNRKIISQPTRKKINLINNL